MLIPYIVPPHDHHPVHDTVDIICNYCNHTACKAVLYLEGLLRKFHTLKVSMLPNHKCNHLYHNFVVEEHGIFGCHNHVHIPECAVAFIHGLCPEPTGIYIGHRDVDGEPQGNMGNINFENGKKVKACISFENKVYPITHVHNFINKSNCAAWSVTFVENLFTNATIICNME